VGRGRSLRDFANGDFEPRRDDHDGGKDDRWSTAESEQYPAYDESAEYSAEQRAEPSYARDYGETGETGYSEALPIYGDTGYSEAMDSVRGGALVPLSDESALLPAVIDDESGPMIIPGTGESMGNPFIQRRERPLTMRIAILTLMACILVTGLFAVSPLGSSAEAGFSSFQALSGVVVWHNDTGYFWYIAQWGDSVDSVASHFGVQIGGIFELNDLKLGQELTVGESYKIPTNPNYGAGYQPPALVVTYGGNGSTTFGSSPWTSIAGNPLPEASCGPNGNGNPIGYKLHAPNWGAVWVRGFSWYHNGVDLAAADGNPIHAAQGGQVIWAGWDVGGLGYSIKINHCNHVSTVYGHMQRLNVSTGQNVNAGDVIGFEGSTGWSTGPHLHFMVEVDNNPVDPMAYYSYNETAITHGP
jgi:murein DD-endopeptidase MepM/ murein hydrolase activator NlpD